MSVSDDESGISIGGVFRHVVQMRWGDLDALNHLNNAMYFRYLEEARMQMFMRCGRSPDRLGVLAHVSCDFLRPLLYPADVVISLTLTRIGRTSMAFDTRFERLDEPGTLYAQGHNVIVGTSAATGRPTPWTAEELAGLKALLEPGGETGG